MKKTIFYKIVCLVQVWELPDILHQAPSGRMNLNYPMAAAIQQGIWIGKPERRHGQQRWETGDDISDTMLCHANVWSTGPELNMNTWCEFRVLENEFTSICLEFMMRQPPLRVKHFCFLFFSNSVGCVVGKSGSRSHAHFSSKDPSWPCSDKLTRLESSTGWSLEIDFSIVYVHTYIVIILYNYFRYISCVFSFPLLGQLENHCYYDFSCSSVSGK